MLEVRVVGPDAAATVLAVVREAFAARPPLDPPADALSETESSIAAQLDRGGGLIATVDERPVGTLVLDPQGPTLFLRRVGVLPGAQHHGVAGALVAAALARSSGFAHVAVLARAELPATVRFWEHRGFTVAGSEPPYLRLTRPAGVLGAETHEVATGDEMRSLGEAVAARLRAGDLVVLSGGLGAGKTTFTQGLGRGLGVRGPVTSPTFVIARVHPSLVSGPALVHVDAYRLGGLDELDDLDLDASLSDSVTVVEWGAGLAEGLADSRLEVTIERATGDDASGSRQVTVRGVGERWGHFP